MEPVRRRGAVIAASVGVLALLGVTAGAVVTLGSSSGHADSAATSSSPPVTATVSSVPSMAVSASPAEPTATSTVKGQVSNGVHTGDLRFFLLTPPRDAEIYGDEAGSPLTAADLASGSADDAAAQRALTTYGFKSGAYRTYLTAGGGAEVSFKLSRFADPASAAQYYDTHYYEGDKLSLPGGYPACAYHLKSGSDESADTLLAISYQGDVHITITVTGGRMPDQKLLQGLLDAQYQRLKTGR
ncbi:hypothetical protein QMK19_31190 [Streptomyces sp. H10-C2]|uniref:hypothetical protein n=1 Tax=unclassified Streptomyces TaxID=2593676 RepID=UPI0024BA12EF|nr:MULTISPECIES: hypothetical protein [unclassified Streptomyces]MDJ0345083.1 hypothetical protein [Streptomyces sp. PH10-H1]MDJ0373988.1 hypothetical protein [Streptomyces sp. H10-C2]